MQVPRPDLGIFALARAMACKAKKGHDVNLEQKFAGRTREPAAWYKTKTCLAGQKGPVTLALTTAVRIERAQQ